MSLETKNQMTEPSSGNRERGSELASEVTSDTASASDRALHIGKPHWLKTEIPTGATYFNIKRDLRERKLFTVCEEAKCPNIAHCWNTNTATFMVLGEVCTRGCRFCNVKTGNPAGWLDANEPNQVAESAQAMGLKYVVITMVDRDDLEDGGAAHIVKVVRRVRELSPEIRIELLVGDFHGNDSAHSAILGAAPDVYAHNLETVERLTPRVRDRRATYRQSLGVLKRSKELTALPVFTKSALMLGLGEERDEVIATLGDMREHGVDFVTIGQYLRPTKKHLSIKRFVHPDEFADYAEVAKSLGFRSVASAPLVRSSYKAREFYEEAIGKKAEARS